MHKCWSAESAPMLGSPCPQQLFETMKLVLNGVCESKPQVPSWDGYHLPQSILKVFWVFTKVPLF